MKYDAKEFTHDYQVCPCGACAVDGGHEYLRRCYKNSIEEDYIDLSETKSATEQ